ncbi:MAG: hypothetical protein ACRD4O_04950, partial [Bryobacteraceae bacterium]
MSFAAVLLIHATASAQTNPAAQQDHPQAQAQPPKQTSKPSKPRHYTPSQKPPRPQPAVIEDGGWSLEPEYWLNRGQPTLRGGAILGSFGTLDYFGHANQSVGGVLSIPAGKQNTLR